MVSRSSVSATRDPHRRSRRVGWLVAMVGFLGVASSAVADCIVQDASGLTRAVLLGEGRATVAVVVRGEKPDAAELQLRRVTGLAAVVAGRLEQNTAVFSGVSDGTWQSSLPTAQIASVLIERPEGSSPSLQSSSLPAPQGSNP